MSRRAVVSLDVFERHRSRRPARRNNNRPTRNRIDADFRRQGVVIQSSPKAAFKAETASRTDSRSGLMDKAVRKARNAAFGFFIRR